MFSRCLTKQLKFQTRCESGQRIGVDQKFRILLSAEASSRSTLLRNRGRSKRTRRLVALRKNYRKSPTNSRNTATSTGCWKLNRNIWQLDHTLFRSAARTGRSLRYEDTLDKVWIPLFYCRPRYRPVELLSHTLRLFFEIRTFAGFPLFFFCSLIVSTSTQMSCSFFTSVIFPTDFRSVDVDTMRNRINTRRQQKHSRIYFFYKIVV